MLGMGGSQLYIPILYWLGMDFKTEAIPLGMLLNIVNSSSASITYFKKKLIDFRVAIPFAATMVVYAPLGAWVNVKIPTKPMIVIFAIFTATAAILMLSGWKPKKGKLNDKERKVLGFSGGSILGFLAGLLGRGGGSFIVPLLYIAGLEAKSAAATSAFVVTFSGLSSFVSHIIIAAKPNWTIWILSIVSVILGSQLGSRVMSGKLKSKAVKKVFGIVLLLVAALLIVKNL